MNKIQVAIADDNGLFRKGLKIGLSWDKNIEVMFEAENGQELLDKLVSQTPHVILIDLDMPVMDGFEAMSIIRKSGSVVKILAISMYDQDELVVYAMESGANGYMLKSETPKEIINAVYTVMKKDYYINAMVNTALINRLGNTDLEKPPFPEKKRITERELQFLKRLLR
jgi:DNA-binding NarL/FixJ family response regulator